MQKMRLLLQSMKTEHCWLHVQKKAPGQFYNHFFFNSEVHIEIMPRTKGPNVVISSTKSFANSWKKSKTAAGTNPGRR
ncbi:Uncharacterized protein TCM_023119 [Theobroma cacao]|uniref:Uncharacterized protein n=1 Tax=Theobroma cacao TaxID=3641 RepID=A0A061EV64_THECC|nr:Uncharacterized protein TCM_023119 [Theobroma cacao]